MTPITGTPSRTKAMLTVNSPLRLMNSLVPVNRINHPQLPPLAALLKRYVPAFL